MTPKLAATAVTCAWLSCAAMAHADASAPAASSVSPAPPATPSADDKKAASDAFHDGDRAFKLGDYRRAAEAYEIAYRRAPHHAPLWNAARAWDRAGEIARAATLYAKYLREAPAKAPDRNSATAALAKIAPKLARLDIHADAGLTNVAVDTHAAEADGADDPTSAQTYTVYVAPGDHVIEARSGDQVVRQSPKVEAGAVVGVALAVPTAKKEEPTPPPQPPPAPTPQGWSPAVVAFGGVLTAITGGLAIWSGLDTLNQKDQFDKSPTQENLDSGHSKQSRTNILIAVSSISGALTIVAAVFLVDWHSKPAPSTGRSERIEIGVGPGSFNVKGSF